MDAALGPHSSLLAARSLLGALRARARPGLAGLGLAGLGLALGSSLALGSGCGALRQNLRNEFVSYRGAWACASAGCKIGDEEQSRAGSNKGELRINDVKLQPRAGLVFYPGKPVETLTASVRDCKGKRKDVPSELVQAPGKHSIGAEPDSWVVWIDEAIAADLEVSRGDCAVLIVTTHSTWSDGKDYDAEGAIKVAR